MKHRTPTPQEKQLITKQIQRYNTELRHATTTKEYQTWLINKGLLMNYEKKMDEAKKTKNQIIKDIQNHTHQLTTLKKQLTKITTKEGNKK